MYEKLRETVDSIRSRCSLQPAIGLILGSGLGAFADSLRERAVLPYSTLPHFPSSTIAGHPGNMVFGISGGVPMVALQGRVHLYEGYSASDVAYPARVLGVLGIRRLIVTNAAGGINESFQAGDLMLIRDHINMMGANPLTGPNPDELGPRFPDMTEAYDPEMRAIALEIARQRGITLREGVYIAVPGPSYETPAEIRMLRSWGADAVGMSTVPEVITANHMKIPVLGVSCITNMAAGILPQKLSHREVLDTAERAGGAVSLLLQGIIPAVAGMDSAR